MTWVHNSAVEPCKMSKTLKISFSTLKAKEQKDFHKLT